MSDCPTGGKGAGFSYLFISVPLAKGHPRGIWTLDMSAFCMSMQSASEQGHKCEPLEAKQKGSEGRVC